MRPFISVSASLIALAILSAPTAAASCDISQTKCALNNGKCNIQFRNKTGDSGGSDGGTNLDQRSSAQTILVKAKDESSDRVGNKLQIVAGAKKTMNVQKKAKKKGGFTTIGIGSQDFGMGVTGAEMSCEDIQAVLNGNGTCKVFHGAKSSDSQGGKFALGYQCDGGKVSGPNNKD